MEKKSMIKRALIFCVMIVTVTVFTVGNYTKMDIDQHPTVLHLPNFFDKETVGTDIIEIPPIEKLRTFNTSNFLSLIHRYTNTFQILCRNQLRVGTVYDGGKEVCLDIPVLPKQPCLVYSFGSNNKFDFEGSIIKWFGCEVHTFDPSMNHIPPNQITNPKGCEFHRTGLSGKDEIVQGKNWKLKTLGTTLKDLHHSNNKIDILKIDIEGSEWAAIEQMIESDDIGRVRQLLVELHFDIHGKNFTYPLSVLGKLYDAGFRIFNRERNVFCPHCNVFKKDLGFWVSYNVEMCYLNTNLL